MPVRDLENFRPMDFCWTVERLLDRGPVTTLTELCHEKLTVVHLSLKTGQFLSVLVMYYQTVRYR